MKFSPAAVLTMYAAFLAAGALFALLLIGFGEAVSQAMSTARASERVPSFPLEAIAGASLVPAQ